MKHTKHKAAAEEVMRSIRVQLPDQVHRRLKSRAALEGLTLCEMIVVIVKEYLDGKRS